MEWILQELSLHLLVEHIVLHIGSHAVGEQELVVLLTAIACVRYDFTAVEAIDYVVRVCLWVSFTGNASPVFFLL